MKRTSLVFALVVAAAVRARAQASIELTLDDAVARGLSASHRLSEAAARSEAAEAHADAAHAPTLPQLAAQAGYTRTNHVETFGVLLPNNQFKVIYPDVPDNYRMRLDLQWPIYTAGRIDALERAARAEASASADDITTARADLKLEIVRAYWALVTAIETERVLNESIIRADAHVRDVRNQFDAGLVPPNEIATAEAQRSRQRMLSAQAQANTKVAEAALARLVGLSVGTGIRPATTLAPPAGVDTSIAALVDRARAGRPERVGLTKRVDAASARRAAAMAGRKPTVAVAGGVDYARPNLRIFPRAEVWRESWDAGVNVNWPLFDGGRTRADVAEADALGRAAAERLAEFDSTLEVDVRQRWYELETSQAAISAANDAVTSAAEARRVVGDRFAAGVATNTDVLDAQTLLLQAELDRTQAIANARLAEARLDRAVGR